MATVRRSRTLRASPQELWRIVGDAHHLPRWWPRVTRVEAVDDDSFTEVLRTERGKPVRADFRVVSSDAPSLRSWAQQVAGTPFERILARSETEIRLEPAGDDLAREAEELRFAWRGVQPYAVGGAARAARRELRRREREPEAAALGEG